MTVVHLETFLQLSLNLWRTSSLIFAGLDGKSVALGNKMFMHSSAALIEGAKVTGLRFVIRCERASEIVFVSRPCV